MTNRNYRIFCLLAFALLTLNFRCDKYLDPPAFEQTFKIPVDISPLKKTYTLNDTIWLETDVQGKMLFDTKTNQNIMADTGRITLILSYSSLQSDITDPGDGFCDVITLNGVNKDRTLSPWSLAATIKSYGCGQPGYRYRIGFNPNYRGTYCLVLPKDANLESCPNKIKWYNASINYTYKNVDLNPDVLNAAAAQYKWGHDKTDFYSGLLSDHRGFVFRVE